MKTKTNHFFTKKNIILLSIITVLFLSGTIISVELAKRVERVIEINSAKDFNNISKNLSAHYIINQQTFVMDEPIIPIGTKEKPFTGTLECLNKNMVMSSICNFTYDSNYISEQFNNDSIDEVNIAPFAYNSGVIRGIRFWYHNLPDLTPYLQKNKTINFGGIAAHNDGWINKCSASSFDGQLDANNINAGSICAINTGEIKICMPGFDLKINCYGDSSIGGLVGINKPAKSSGNNKPKSLIYCSKGGSQRLYFQKVKEKYNVYYGSLCGSIEGGEIEDCSCGGLLYWNNGAELNLYAGGVAGIKRGNEKLNIKSVFSNYSVENGFFGYFSSLISKIETNSVVFSSVITINNIKLTNASSFFGICYSLPFNDEYIIPNNSYYYNSSILCNNTILNHSQETSFQNINLEILKFNLDIWSKNEEKQILEIKVKIWQ